MDSKYTIKKKNGLPVIYKDGELITEERYAEVEEHLVKSIKKVLKDIEDISSRCLGRNGCNMVDSMLLETATEKLGNLTRIQNYLRIAEDA